MKPPDALPAALTKVFRGLAERGLCPVLVGGMALVLLGSKRVTQDFDVVVRRQDEADLSDAVKILYGAGFCLASKLNEHHEVVRYIDNLRVAIARLQMQEVSSAIFWHPKARLRIDLLFDFPFPAADLAKNARAMSLGSKISVLVADPVDLLKMKEIALSARKEARDAQDIEFLRGLHTKKG